MKKLLKMTLALLMAVTMAACSNNSEPVTEGTYTAGTYTGTAQGNNGEVTVEVTLSADKIEKVEVTEHKETAGISDTPIAEIPAAIVELQSLNIDTVTGATNTSNAILDAVKAALEEAGADVDALMNAAGSEKEEAALEDATYDVVVLGAGGAGLAAAIEAQANGANVVIVEKQPYAGGNTILSYAELACPNNWLQEEQESKTALNSSLKKCGKAAVLLVKKNLLTLLQTMQRLLLNGCVMKLV